MYYTEALFKINSLEKSFFYFLKIIQYTHHHYLVREFNGHEMEIFLRFSHAFYTIILLMKTYMVFSMVYDNSFCSRCF